MNNYIWRWAIFLGLYWASFYVTGNALTLQSAVQAAQQSDEWHDASGHRQQALLSRSKSAKAWQDPRVSLGLANVPVGGVSLDQEPMTQARIGISQVLPRGDSLRIRGKQFRIQAKIETFRRAERRAAVTQHVSLDWLTAYEARNRIRMLEADRDLFQQLVEIAEANYASTSANARQQDVLQAQLELIRLEDRLTTEQQRLDQAQASLSEWLGRQAQQPLPEAMTGIVIPELSSLPSLSLQALAERLTRHPVIQRVATQQNVAKTKVALAKQAYKPQWMLSASYGHRQNSPQGMARDDFMSVGVSVDVPLFSQQRQDHDVAAAISESEAIKTEQRVQVRSMVAKVNGLLQRFARLKQRQSLYSKQLLTQVDANAEAALSAYTHDDGDFSDVVQARVTQLNARLDALTIDVTIEQTLVQLQYWLTTVNEDSHGDTL